MQHKQKTNFQIFKKFCRNTKIVCFFFKENANFIAENWRKSPKIGESRRKLAKVAENWRKSPKIGESRQTNVIIALAPPGSISVYLNFQHAVSEARPETVSDFSQLHCVSGSMTSDIGKFNLSCADVLAVSFR
jgi:hypothetical protein